PADEQRSQRDHRAASGPIVERMLHHCPVVLFGSRFGSLAEFGGRSRRRCDQMIFTVTLKPPKRSVSLSRSSNFLPRSSGASFMNVPLVLPTSSTLRRPGRAEAYTIA